jgi:hypothetical protein
MLTTEDADAYDNVHPDGQLVGFRDILVTSSFSSAVVRETPSRGSGRVESSGQFEKTHCLSASH